jgi:hypothetical protein
LTSGALLTGIITPIMVANLVYYPALLGVNPFGQHKLGIEANFGPVFFRKAMKFKTINRKLFNYCYLYGTQIIVSTLSDMGHLGIDGFSQKWSCVPLPCVLMLLTGRIHHAIVRQYFNTNVLRMLELT